MKPLIGITASMEVGKKGHQISHANVDAITRAGGIPVILPNILEEDNIEELAQRIDGLYATGGADIDPTLFGEEPHKDLGGVTPTRDFFEITITKKILELGKPFLGVCRGSQVLNVAAGGTLYQDIYAQSDRELLQHNQKAFRYHGSHFVYVEKDSLLYRLTGQEKFKINSYHHQAVKDIAAGFQSSGRASDGIIEAIEKPDHPFVLGVQWHPELMLVNDDELSLKIFKGFIEACQK